MKHKKLIISILIIVMSIGSIIGLTACSIKETVNVELDYQIINFDNVETDIILGNLLNKPSDPTFINKIFNDGIGGVNGYSDFEFPISFTEVNEGYNINSDYIFIGWYKETECIRPWIFSEDRAYKNTILYAKWELLII